MALTKIKADGLTADLIDETKLADNSIDSEHYNDGSIDNAHLADDAVGVAELSATGTASSSTFLRGDNSWVTPTDTNTQLAFANDANNRVVTGTGSGLNGEANLTFDGSQLGVGSSANYGSIGTAAAFQIQGTNTGSNTSMNIVNAATSNASSTCDVNAWQDYRLSTRIISGRENNTNWTASASGAASFLAFYTNNAGTVAEKIRIPSTGGITFNGDSAAANALSDYEEGDWTPSFGGLDSVTYQTQFGRYTKIGRQVFCTVVIDATGIDESNTIDLNGLPFSSADSNDNGQRSTWVVVNGGHNAGITETTARFRSAGSIWQGVKGTTSTSYLTGAQLCSSGTVNITGAFSFYVS
tara:strand:+ start:1977 stop:3041 length:1065 start_codon:yes stop_codon:yes gene_type:complete